MNKLTLIICSVISIFLINYGFSISLKCRILENQYKSLNLCNFKIEKEILLKRRLTPKPAVELPKAYSLVINEMRSLEVNRGISMNLTLNKIKGNDDIKKNYSASHYKGIQKLPVIIQIDQNKNEIDLMEVLDDIYHLEISTDLKLTEINKDNNSLTLKGDIYGIQ